MHISGRTFVSAHDGIVSISQYTAYARGRVIRWCPSKYSAHPQHVSATPAGSIWRNRVIHSSGSWFWVDFAAFLSISEAGSCKNELWRRRENAGTRIGEFSTLVL